MGRERGGRGAHGRGACPLPCSRGRNRLWGRLPCFAGRPAGTRRTPPGAQVSGVSDVSGFVTCPHTAAQTNRTLRSPGKQLPGDKQARARWVGYKITYITYITYLTTFGG